MSTGQKAAFQRQLLQDRDVGSEDVAAVTPRKLTAPAEFGVSIPLPHKYLPKAYQPIVPLHQPLATCNSGKKERKKKL